jgi:predicted alpha/beta-fold hydrolase
MNFEYLLSEPDNKTKSVAIFLPGMSGGALDRKYENLASILNLNGLALMRLECWTSTDDLKLKSFETLKSDIVSVIEYLKQNGYEEFYGIGKSLGGSALFLAQISELEKLVLWAPVINLGKDSTLDSLFSRPFVEIDSLDQITVSASLLKNYTSKVFVLVGTEDSVVSIENLEKAVSLLPYGKLLTIPDFGHTPRDIDEWQKLFELTADFIKEKDAA